jgi:predicted nucleotidyltransferase component of viral defense system
MTNTWAILGYQDDILQIHISHSPPRLPSVYDAQTCRVVSIDEVPTHKVEEFNRRGLARTPGDVVESAKNVSEEQLQRAEAAQEFKATNDLGSY